MTSQHQTTNTIIDFINSSTKHDMLLLLNMIAKDMLVWDGEKLTNVESISLNCTRYELRLDNIE